MRTHPNLRHRRQRKNDQRTKTSKTPQPSPANEPQKSTACKSSPETSQTTKKTTPASSYYPHEDSAPTGKDKTINNLLSQTRTRLTLPCTGRIRQTQHQPNQNRIKTNQRKPPGNTIFTWTLKDTEPNHKCVEALKALEKYAIFVKILGSYPKAI